RCRPAPESARRGRTTRGPLQTLRSERPCSHCNRRRRRAPVPGSRQFGRLRGWPRRRRSLPSPPFDRDPMNIHEYQAKEILARYGVPAPRGVAVDTPAQAARAFRDRGGGLAVVKAQIHAGGRGKAGGVKLVRTADEARKVAQNLLGKALVTPQTGPAGRVVK